MRDLRAPNRSPLTKFPIVIKVIINRDRCLLCSRAGLPRSRVVIRSAPEIKKIQIIVIVSLYVMGPHLSKYISGFKHCRYTNLHYSLCDTFLDELLNVTVSPASPHVIDPCHVMLEQQKEIKYFFQDDFISDL